MPSKIQSAQVAALSAVLCVALSAPSATGLAHAATLQGMSAPAALAAATRQQIFAPTAPGLSSICPAAQDAAAYDGKEAFMFIVPGKDGWYFRTSADLPTDTPISSANIEGFKEVRDILRRRGTELVLMMQPVRMIYSEANLDRSAHAARYYDRAAQVAVYQETQRRLKAAGLTLVDPPATISDPSVSVLEPGAPLFQRADHHWTSTGARYSAIATARTIKKLPAYESITKKTYTTQLTGQLRYVGSISNALADICGVPDHPVMVNNYQTTTQDSGGLLGDDEVSIALAGTSFSFSNQGNVFNFAGFLQEYLSADVANYALSGGGFEASIQSFLLSEEFKSAPPKILIWEFAHRSLPNPSSSEFDWVRGAALGDCKAQKKPKEVQMTGGEQEILLRPADLSEGKPGAATRLVLDTTAADLRVFKLRIEYRDGTSKTVGFDASVWNSAPKKLILRLSDSNRKVKRVLIAPAQAVSGSVSAHICDAGVASQTGPFDFLVRWWRTLFA